MRVGDSRVLRMQFVAISNNRRLLLLMYYFSGADVTPLQRKGGSERNTHCSFLHKTTYDLLLLFMRYFYLMLCCVFCIV
jgi:hypothetical protein